MRGISGVRCGECGAITIIMRLIRLVRRGIGALEWAFAQSGASRGAEVGECADTHSAEERGAKRRTFLAVHGADGQSKDLGLEPGPNAPLRPPPVERQVTG